MSYEVDFDFFTTNLDASAIATERLRLGKFTGVVSGMPSDYYHSLTGYYSSSDLKEMYSTSPRHFKNYWKKKIDPSSTSKSSEPMLLGSGVHSMLLTPQIFDEEFRVVEKVDKRTTAGKAYAVELEFETRYLINADQKTKIEKMCQSVLAIKRNKNLLQGGVPELALFWECPFSGLMFKAKVDMMGDNHFIELKTCRDGSPDGFGKDAYNMNYDLSLRHYQVGIEAMFEKKLPPYIMSVENTEPFVAQTYRASEMLMETGHAKWLSAVSALSDCVKSDVWYGYFNSEMQEVEPELSPPVWGIRQLGIELKVEDSDGI